MHRVIGKADGPTPRTARVHKHIHDHLYYNCTDRTGKQQNDRESQKKMKMSYPDNDLILQGVRELVTSEEHILISVQLPESKNNKKGAPERGKHDKGSQSNGT